MKDIITGILLLFTTASCIYFWEYIITIKNREKILMVEKNIGKIKGDKND